MTPYYVSVTPGIEEIAWDEATEKLNAPRLWRTERGKLFFDADDAPVSVLALRSVDNVFAYIGELDGVPGGPEGLSVIETYARTVDVSGALALHAQVVGEKASPSFRVTTRRSGQHEFTSVDIHGAAGQGIVDRFGWRVDLTGHDLEFRFDVRDGQCLAGLRLSDESLHRRTRVVHGVASLKPTLAYAMLRLVGSSPGDVFLDPMCGTATLLLERAELGPSRVIVGGDLFLKPLELGRENLAAAGAPAHLLRWDARHLPIRSDSVDAAACNLPFGRRVGSHLVNVHLFPAFIRELERVLRPGGKAALLSLERRLLERQVEQRRGLNVLRRIPIKLAELRPSIYVLRKALPRT